MKSLTVNKIDDTSDKWIKAANTKAGITDLQGFDAVGDLAHLGKDGEPTGTGVEYEAGETLYGRLTAETTDLYADWNGLQTRLPDTGGILRRILAGLLLAGGGLALWTVGRRRRTE